MFTIESLLKLKSMNEATLVAGEDGLHKKIEWSHVIELRNIDEYIRRDTLIIHTGVAIDDPSNRLIEIVNSSINRGASGMLVVVGHFIFEIPQSVKELANKNDFPIIIISYEASIIDITYQIGYEIFKDKDRELISNDKDVVIMKDKIKKCDLNNHIELRRTLITYLDTGGNATLSSEVLYIHRNTMKYRINKLEEMLECNLRSERVRFILKLALA